MDHDPLSLPLKKQIGKNEKELILKNKLFWLDLLGNARGKQIPSAWMFISVLVKKHNVQINKKERTARTKYWTRELTKSQRKKEKKRLKWLKKKKERKIMNLCWSNKNRKS